MDKLLDWSVVALPTLLSLVGILVTTEPTATGKKNRIRWRVGLLIFGAIISSLTYWQQQRQRNHADAQAASAKQQASVAAKESKETETIILSRLDEIIKMPNSKQQQEAALKLKAELQGIQIPKSQITQRTTIQLIFKNSPLFTEIRKKHITFAFNGYYTYLTKKVGFELPKEIPPIGESPGNVMLGGGAAGAPSYFHSIYIPESSIDDPEMINNAYSLYIFQLFSYGTSGMATVNDSQASTIYGCYYLASYRERKFCQFPSPINEWLNGLWNVRAKLGHEYTDKMLLYALKSWNSMPPSSKNNFSDFFLEKLSVGQGVVENSPSDYKILVDTLKHAGVSLQDQ